jgi:hypothetical protein
VLKPRDETDLPYEADLPSLGRRIGVENLDGDLSLVLQVAREVHRCVCALADLALDLVVTAERDSQWCDRVGEGRRGALPAELSHRHGGRC